MHNKERRRQEGQEREAEKKWKTETVDVRKGKGWGGVHGVNKMDNTVTFMSLHYRDFQEGKQGI